MRAVLGDVAEHIEHQNVPVLWAFRPIPDNCTSSLEVTVIDTLKSLITQALQSPQALVTESQLTIFSSATQQAKTEGDWFRLLSLALANFRLVCIAIDNEVLNQSSSLSSSRTTQLPARLAEILEKHKHGDSNTIVKVILTGYDSALNISQWHGTTVETSAVWATAPDSNINRPSRASGFASFIKLPTVASTTQTVQERDILMNTSRDSSTNVNTSIDDVASRPPVAIERSGLTTLTPDIKPGYAGSRHTLPVGFTDGTQERQSDFQKGSSGRAGSFSSESTDAIDGAGRAKKNAQAFTDDFKQFLKRFMEPKGAKSIRSGRTRIKIALLDTGILQNKAGGGLPDRRNATMEYREKQGFTDKNEANPIKMCKSFLDKNKSTTDSCGHGTQLACLLLEFAPDADLYIARVSSAMEFDNPRPIAEALRWAAKEVHADIITMSFGWNYHVQEVSEAMSDVLKEQTESGHKPLLFASASNHGLRYSNRSFPAWENNKTICAYVLDGLGADTSTLNPPRMDHCSNFGTFGHGVKVKWDGEYEYKSGTSYATPFLVATAANYLDWLDHHASTLGEREYKLAREKSYVEEVFFKSMTVKEEPQSRMCFVAPWHFFKFNAHNFPNTIHVPDEVKEVDKKRDAFCVEIVRDILPPT
ncbi:hypothetical protein M434DRAFT_387105 [Hypoxylon sp. CO27-5]|nr:hypothetical protein M434DRAFT_387105 [Hypoxylon sp. CO27-5]